jgi:hypothetical protein
MAFTMTLIIIAASVALMLGVIGIYGVISYIVSQRTGEIGVRLALGADPGHVARMIIRQGALVALAGVIVGLGLGLAYAGSRLIASLLYGVSATASALVTQLCLRRQRCCCCRSRYWRAGFLRDVALARARRGTTRRLSAAHCSCATARRWLRSDCPSPPGERQVARARYQRKSAARSVNEGHHSPV